MKNQIISVMLILLTFCSCVLPKDTYYRIEIENQSNKRIQYFIARPGSEHVYPDIELPSAKIQSPDIEIGSTFRGDGGEEWNALFSKLPAGKLSIYIFDSDVIKNNSWDDIRTNYMILKRFDVTHQELVDKKFIITYVN